MTTVLLDTHTLLWLSTEPKMLSKKATQTIDGATTLAVAAISWYELAWLAHHGRISSSIPIRTWLDDLSRSVATLELTPAIASTAANLPPPFTGDPADRIIYATAVEHGTQLVTRDGKLRKFPQPREITVW